MRNLFRQLRELLAPGFYPDNFLAVARLAEEGSWQAERPLGLFVLSLILRSLGEDWGADEQGIEAATATELIQTMEPAVTAYLAAASERNMSDEEEVQLLNELVHAFLRWRSSHD